MSTIGIVCCWVAVVWGRGHMMGKECSLVAKLEISRQCALHMYNIALVCSSDIFLWKHMQPRAASKYGNPSVNMLLHHVPLRAHEWPYTPEHCTPPFNWHYTIS